MKKIVKKAQAGTSLGQKTTSKRPKLGTKSVGRPYEKNPGEGGKNFGKSDAGNLKPTYGGAKGGKSIKKAQDGSIDYQKAHRDTSVGDNPNWKRVETYRPSPQADRDEVVKSKTQRSGNVKTKSIGVDMSGSEGLTGNVRKTVVSPKGDTISDKTRSINPDRAIRRMNRKVNSLTSKEVSQEQLRKGGKIAKSGAKMTKKGGMAAFEKTSFDKKADVPGGRHGAEGSAKDKKMDKIDAKKMGFIKGKKK